MMFVEVLVDVLQDDNSPYEDWDPLVSVASGWILISGRKANMTKETAEAPKFDRRRKPCSTIWPPWCVTPRRSSKLRRGRRASGSPSSEPGQRSPCATRACACRKPGPTWRRAPRGGRSTDAYVHEKPWTAIGIAAAIGFLLGYLGRRR